VSSTFHFASKRSAFRRLRRTLCGALITTLGLFCLSRPASAQTATSDIVASIQGNDLSINDEPLVAASTLVSVENGNVVTVHSGEARMRLADGGEVSVCGPAKFTVLANSEGAITLALDFGRMHVDLPASVKLRVLTPAIVATPVDINGGKRDIVVGLDQNDSLCVLAALGAVQLEQQFSGQRMIVPESGDFSLQNGQLAPVADTGGSCKCAAVPQAVPGRASGTETASTFPAPADTHPVAPPSQQQAANPPSLAQPANQIELPPMVYSSAVPSPPNVPTEETAALVREIRDDPDWEFTGSVEAPDFARAMSRALGEGGEPSESHRSTESAKKPGGFWASLKRFLIG
jgi:hypothetical protein